MNELENKFEALQDAVCDNIKDNKLSTGEKLKQIETKLDTLDGTTLLKSATGAMMDANILALRNYLANIAHKKSHVVGDPDLVPELVLEAIQ